MTHRLTAILLVLGLSCSQAQQPAMRLSAENLDKLDRSRKIASLIDNDRLSKQLMSGTGSGDVVEEEANKVTNRILLEGLLRLYSKGGLESLIAKELQRGDDILSRCLQTALVALNMPAHGAKALVEKWAMKGPDENLGGVLANMEATPDVGAAMVSYFTDADDDWVKLVRGVSALVTGESNQGREALGIAVANATGASLKAVLNRIEKAKDGDFGQLWNLQADGRKILDSRGALAREILAQQNTGGSFYEAGWAAACERIAEDQILSKSYMSETAGLTPLYTAFVRNLEIAMKGRGKEALVGSIILGGYMPESRFRWMLEELSGGSYKDLEKELKTGKGDRLARANMADNLERALSTNPVWAGALIWHLSRPAEATALSTRLSLPNSHGSDEEFARRYVQAGTPLGGVVDSYVESRGGYSHYPGGRKEMVEKVESGEVQKEALLKLAETIAAVLATEDKPWDSVVETTSPGDWVNRMTVEAIERVPGCATAWIQTLVKNDKALSEGFSNWLVQNKALPNENPNAQRWIASVAAGSQGFGNAEAARVKKLFTEYISTPEGWGKASTRLKLEGVSFPTVIREMLIDAAIRSPDDFWKLFRILTASEGDTMARLRPYLQAYISSSRLPQMVLEEAAAQNAFAADAGAPMWKALLTPGSPASEALIQIILKGQVMTPQFALGNLCFIEEFFAEPSWTLAEPMSGAMLEKVLSRGVKLPGATVRDRLSYALTNHATECGWIYSTMFADPGFRKRWSGRVVSKVLFMGKAPGAAWLFLQDGPLMSIWREEMGRQIAADPYLLRAFVDSLVTRRIGDRAWAAQVDGIRRNIAGAVYYDRILSEQMLAYPGMEYRNALDEQVRDIFGQYVADQWDDASKK
jgi:hypothetical protein